MTSPLKLSRPQRNFAGSTSPYPALVAGYGSGKTTAGAVRAISLKSRCIGQDVAYYLPTYALIADIAYGRFAELLDLFSVRHTLVKSPYPEVRIPDWEGRILFRTMDTPERIIGYEVAHSVLDELDTLPEDKARTVWTKVIARNRQKCAMRNTVAAVTTPEGFRFVYRNWVAKPLPGSRLYRASTNDNAANLPAGYIDTLRDNYSPQLLAAYLDGEFVNLTSGSVYSEFDRALNATAETIQSGDVLHVGMDFNVGAMAAAICVDRTEDGEVNPHAVAEVVGAFDTPAMCAILKERYPEHRIIVYPDASGSARKSSNASTSDIQILREAGFTVRSNSRNPAIKDRILSMNRMIHNRGKRRLRVNAQTCPHIVEALEQQAYDRHGFPDKLAGLDHIADGLGYLVVSRYPLAERPMSISMGYAT